MWKKLSLKSRIIVLLAALVSITLAGGLVMMWYTVRIENVFSKIIDRDVAAFRSAEAMETALINQKGFVSYYFMDRNPEWLKKLGEYRQIFLQEIEKTKQYAEDEAERRSIKEIESVYASYIREKDKVIDFYTEGDWASGETLHHHVRRLYFTLLDHCESYKVLYVDRIQKEREKTHEYAAKLRYAALAAMLASFILGILLVFLLVFHILGPMRRLVDEAKLRTDHLAGNDEISALAGSVRGLIRNAEETHSELERSRRSLMESKKMAMVGKLAAGTAHSIRNPLTSVKMRLFSLSRSLILDTNQKEDFDVISQEIRHIDTILQNFLEFSRPPKLKIQPMSPSTVVDNALQLLIHRLNSYEAAVTVKRKTPLPEALVDPEQMKEVIVNLIINACEAMERGGRIIIRESVETDTPVGKAAVIRLSDDGPGIPETVKNRIFEPFFTTKNEGTGLGLSIAARLIEEHGGLISLDNEPGPDTGAAFTILLPLEKGAEA